MLADAHGVINQLHLLRVSKSVSWVLQIPVSSISCYEVMTLVIKPCALFPYSVHMCCTLVPGMLHHPSHGADCPINVRRSCDSHWDLIACIISYLDSDLTLPLNRYHGPLWYFVRQGSPVLTFFPLDQTNFSFKPLDLYLSQRFCEQVCRVILPWDVTDRDSLVLDLFVYIVVTNIHMFDPCLLCQIRC